MKAREMSVLICPSTLPTPSKEKNMFPQPIFSWVLLANEKKKWKNFVNRREIGDGAEDEAE